VFPLVVRKIDVEINELVVGKEDSNLKKMMEL